MRVDCFVAMLLAMTKKRNAMTERTRNDRSPGTEDQGKNKRGRINAPLSIRIRYWMMSFWLALEPTASNRTR